MTKSYFTHLGPVFLVHVFILMGTWQLSQSEFIQTQMKSVGNGVMKLQIAVSRPEQKTVVPLAPINPQRPQTQQVQQESVTAQATSAQATGSEYGTSAQGKNDLLSVYKAELRAMIDKNKEYPPMSRRLGQQGTVVVAFTLLEDGHIIDVKVDRPSPYERLNASAVEAVKKVERFRPIPKEIGESKMDFKVPVKFFTI
jgi:periplasmic protein TonB